MPAQAKSIGVQYKTNGYPSIGGLKSANWYLGVYGELGPTANTGYYTTLETGAAYTVFMNKTSQGPSMVQVNSDSALIALANKIFGTNLTTLYEAVGYFLIYDNLVTNIESPRPTVTLELLLYFNSYFMPSYSGGGDGADWYSLGSCQTPATSGWVSPVWYEQDVMSYSFYADMGNCFYYVENTYPMGQSANWTTCAWIYWTGNNGTWAQIFDSGNYGLGTNYMTWISPDGYLATYDGSWQYSINPVTTNGWTFISLSKTGSQVRFFINGTYNVQRTFSYTPGVTGDNLYIGCNPDNPYQLIGYIAQAYIYNRALSDYEIAQNFYWQKTDFGL